MLFELKCIDPETKDVRLFSFDNMTNAVGEGGCEADFASCIHNGIAAADADRLGMHESVLSFASKSEAAKKRLAESYADAGVHKEAQRFSHADPIVGKAKRIANLKIQIGFACNYHCRYCLQSADRLAGRRQPSDEDIACFFEMFNEAGVSPEPDGLITLWGGEPLVYGELVRKLVVGIRRHWGDRTVLSIFTNGVLLTHGMTDFLLSHGVKVCISHDGPGQVLRGGHDPLRDKKIRSEWLYLFEQSRKTGFPMAFFSVISPLNCDLFALRDYFLGHFSPEVGFAFGGAASEYADLPDECIIREPEAKILRETLLRAVLTEPEKWPGVRRRVLNLIGRFIHKTPASRIRWHCNAADPRVLCVDLAGNVLSCQNRSAPHAQIGHLSSYDKIVNRLFTHWSHRQQCPKCLVLGACKGGCPDLTDQGQTRCCANDFAFHYAHFYAAWYLLTGTLIESVNPGVPFPMPKPRNVCCVPIHPVSKEEVQP